MRSDTPDFAPKATGYTVGGGRVSTRDRAPSGTDFAAYVMLTHTGKLVFTTMPVPSRKLVPSFQAVSPDLRSDRKRIANMRLAHREWWQAIAQSQDAIKDTLKLLTEIETT